VYYTPRFKDENGEYPYKYFAIYSVFMVFFSIIESTSFVTQMAFYAKVSDEAIGGTYMTMLATISNLGKRINIFNIKNVNYLFSIHFLHNQEVCIPER
jgi:hypothetical protein